MELLVMSNSNRDMAPCWFYVGYDGERKDGVERDA